MSVLLDIRDLRVRFGAVEAVRGVSLTVDEGEVLGLVGESGSGKSATALAVMGLLPKTAMVDGQIFWRGAGTGGGTDLLREAPEAMRHVRGREIAIIFQEPMTALNPVMTVGRQVAECAEARARGADWRRGEAKGDCGARSGGDLARRRGITATIRTSFRAGNDSGSSLRWR